MQQEPKKREFNGPLTVEKAERLRADVLAQLSAAGVRGLTEWKESLLKRLVFLSRLIEYKSTNPESVKVADKMVERMRERHYGFDAAREDSK
jgi:hypothetical protein